MLVLFELGHKNVQFCEESHELTINVELKNRRMYVGTEEDGNRHRGGREAKRVDCDEDSEKGESMVKEKLKKSFCEHWKIFKH